MKKYTYDQEFVINQFKEIHGDKYNYSLVNYINDRTKVKVICKEHGEFEITPNSHKILKSGCYQCSRLVISKKNLLSQEEFISKIKNKFGENKFNFSKLVYKGSNKEATIICNDCKNELNFKSSYDILRLKGCKYCIEKNKKFTGLSNKEFIDKCNLIHEGKYFYELVNYKGQKYKIKIICPKHGIFEQYPSDHLYQKCGCPSCWLSKGELEIKEYLTKNNIINITEHKIQIEKIDHYFDFYLPERNILIEFNGKQHYEPINFFGGLEGFNILKNKDEIRREYCDKEKIRLIILSYKDLNKIEQILDEML